MEKSEDGTNYSTIDMDDDYLNNIITTTWIRKYIKVRALITILAALLLLR
jgi:hypothetical protein